jgi:ubiquitin carboxyl-terminal hydrolase 47
LKEYITQGEYVYELYSILIHSGSAMGGHYYAYIKSFEDGKWYNFNDSSVEEIKEGNVNDEIQKMYGGNPTSAYMLQYRQYDHSQVEDESKMNFTISNDQIPDYLKEDIDKEIDEFLKQQIEIEEKLLKI